MAKSLVLGNGNILVCLDKFGQVADFYFPYVGLENHIGYNHRHKIGVFTEGKYSWIDDGSWKAEVLYEPDALVSKIRVVNRELKIKIEFADAVYNEKNIFIRKAKVFNLDDRQRAIKIFFHQEFCLYETSTGNTVFFDPRERIIFHYKSRRIFLIGGWAEKEPFSLYTTGIAHSEGKEGSYKDAEDGILSQNPVEYGSVDSVIGFELAISNNTCQDVYFWACVGKTFGEVKELHHYLLEKGPAHLLKTTADFWKAWINQPRFTFFGLEKPVIDAFKISLFAVRTHIDNNGAIIASGDADILQGGKDTYAYMWPRDAAFTVLAMDNCGYSGLTRKFFEFINEVITPEGYLLHKYNPDRSLGSSWHPWTIDNVPQLPIQEDETALALWALWNHYQSRKDLEFIESIYNSFIKKTADFLVAYRDRKTSLPEKSYDLWEEKLGISTFTSASVYGALQAACFFAKLLGKEEDAEKFKKAAGEIKEAILNYLYDKESGLFLKMISVDKFGTIFPDKTVDISSVYGIFHFGVAEITDPLLWRAIELTRERLTTKNGGLARYQGDRFFCKENCSPGNPWFIASLWSAQFDIAAAKNWEDMLQGVLKTLDWVVKHSLSSGIIPEQIDAETNEPLSVSPLTESHGIFVYTVVEYLKKLEELGISQTTLS